MEGEYTGHVKDGKVHGVGVCIYTDGSRYQGDWKAGLKCGRGTHSFASGDQFEGEWENGWMHGLGVYTWKIGDKYIGEVRSRSPAARLACGAPLSLATALFAPGAVRANSRLRHLHVAHQQQVRRAVDDLQAVHHHRHRLAWCRPAADRRALRNDLHGSHRSRPRHPRGPPCTVHGEVVVVGQSNWGGTVELVVVVRPWFHDGLATDPYAESYVNAWLDAEF